jgi:hypothetical protein
MHVIGEMPRGPFTTWQPRFHEEGMAGVHV